LDDTTTLTEALAGHFGKPLDQLPVALRKRVEKEFFILPWDSLSQAQRELVAAQLAAQRSEATEEAERAFGEGYWVVKVGYDYLGRFGYKAAARKRLLSLRQRRKARRERNRDAFSELLRRTAEYARHIGRPIKRPVVIELLGNCDSENILRPDPAATALYGEKPDPKRTYYDRKAGRVYFFDRKKKAVRAIDVALISRRLCEIRRKSYVNRKFAI
jgi:hypothetical protein